MNAIETKERPILFSAPMIRAILAGKKLQTRRVVKPQPPEWCRIAGWTCFTPKGSISFSGSHPTDGPAEKWIKCPWFTAGETLHLWVKENFFVDHGDFDKGGPLPKERPDWADDMLHYCADGDCCAQIPECACDEVGKPKIRPSIHMPRWASRITLEVTSVRAERVQAITEKDADAEGFPSVILHGAIEFAGGMSARASFAELWDQLNAARGFSWASNPWVFVVSFRRIEK